VFSLLKAGFSAYHGAMATKGRKRRNRRKNKANHGKRPNAGRK
jgi:hypothetical protein